MFAMTNPQVLQRGAKGNKDGHFVEGGIEIPITKTNPEKMPYMVAKPPNSYVSEKTVI